MARLTHSPGSDGPGLRTLVRAGVLLAVALVIVGIAFHYGFVAYTRLRPVKVSAAEHELEVDRPGRTVRHGASSLTRRGDLWTLRLEGPPADIGAAHGALAGRLFHQIDARVSDLVAAHRGGSIDAWAALTGLRWQFHEADKVLDDARRRELAALAAALPLAGPGALDAYHRLFLYQCFDELAIEYDALVVEGLAFASTPRRAPDGTTSNMVIGRSFTLEVGPGFSPDRVVSFYYPDGKYPFVSIGWAGLVGVVTGINARGLFVALNPARTDDPPEDGQPIALVLRTVLEEADTLDQAIELLRAASLRTGGAVLIADGPARKAAVLELSTRPKEERRPTRGDGDALLWATDHLTSEVFERDANNDRIRRYTGSGSRYDRLGELLGRAPVDVARAAAILRDRSGVGDTELGLGNRNALDHLQLAHAVIIDATAMVMWVNEGPSAVGRFRAYDLRHWLTRERERPAPPDDLPADRLLHGEEFADFEEAEEALEHARALYAEKRLDHARNAARVALALAPDLGPLHRLLGDIERERGEPEEALRHYRRYLELHPGQLRDQERVRGLIAELGG
ncbi:MAG: hypothetical protein KC636_11445 [Myxococcales bacterium]|nr:hypothetical protein [Myxococcales bacterium]